MHRNYKYCFGKFVICQNLQLCPTEAILVRKECCGAISSKFQPNVTQESISLAVATAAIRRSKIENPAKKIFVLY